MKLLEQFGIILTLTFIVETFKELVPLPVPASVYGLVLMLLLLKFKILNISAIKDASKLLIETNYAYHVHSCCCWTFKCLECNS